MTLTPCFVFVVARHGRNGLKFSLSAAVTIILIYLTYEGDVLLCIWLGCVCVSVHVCVCVCTRVGGGGSPHYLLVYIRGLHAIPLLKI